MPFQGYHSQAMGKCKNGEGKELALFHGIPLKYSRKTELGIKAFFSCDWKYQLTYGPCVSGGQSDLKGIFLITTGPDPYWSIFFL